MSSDWFGCVLVISLYIAEVVSESVLDGDSFSALFQLYFKNVVNWFIQVFLTLFTANNNEK